MPAATATAGTVHVVLPAGVDDPATPSGGNRYDRRLCDGLAARGWTVREHLAAGSWPSPRPPERTALGRWLSALPTGAVVLLDGLLGCSVPELLRPQADRLRLVVLVHLPLDGEGEAAVLACARAVVVTSGWTRRWLLDHYPLPAAAVRVARPGVDAAPPAPGTDAGDRLLCVAAVVPAKGHEVLRRALVGLADRPWSCVCAGPTDRDAAFVAGLRTRAVAEGLGERLHLVGPLAGADLDRAYATADLLVLASAGETYAMVVTEALARGLPVVATEVGGIPEALGRTPDGRLPGLLVPPGDPQALSAALRRWLTDAGLRSALRAAAADRRTRLSSWAEPVDRVAGVLAEVAA